jgi:hypothetical protein
MVFGGADILVCRAFRADRNVCPTSSLDSSPEIVSVMPIAILEKGMAAAEAEGK